MRAIITAGTWLASITLIILIHCTIIGNNAREREISTGLTESMDYAYDKMIDNFYDPDFINYYVNDDGSYDESIVNELMDKFCVNLQAGLTSDGTLKVQLLNINMEEGILQLRVTESFRYPYMGKTGVFTFEKTYVLKQL